MKQGKRNEVYMLTGETVNEIAAAVNFVNESLKIEQNGSSETKFYQNGEIRIFYTGSTLPQFSAIALTGLAIKPNDDNFKYTTPTFTAGLVTEAKPDVPFAICAEPAKKNKYTKAVISGVIPAKVSIKDTAHKYAKPTPGSSTGALESCEAGTARIIYSPGKTGQQWCILQLGAGGAESYDGPFALSLNSSGTIDCAAGFLNRNGEIVSVPAKQGLSPATGYVCVTTKINNNSWTTPEIKIVSQITNECYPVGYCQMKDSVPVLTQYRVALAIIMITGNCPVNATT